MAGAGAPEPLHPLGFRNRPPCLGIVRDREFRFPRHSEALCIAGAVDPVVHMVNGPGCFNRNRYRIRVRFPTLPSIPIAIAIPMGRTPK